MLLLSRNHINDYENTSKFIGLHLHYLMSCTLKAILPGVFKITVVRTTPREFLDIH